MPLCVTVLMLLILASSGLRETVAVQAYMAASPRPTWDHSPAQKCSPGSMTSGRAYPGRDRPCIHCEAYRMQQHPFLRPPACSGVPQSQRRLAWDLIHIYHGLQPSIERQQEEHIIVQRRFDRWHAMSSIRTCSAVICFAVSAVLSAGLHGGFRLMYLGYR